MTVPKLSDITSQVSGSTDSENTTDESDEDLPEVFAEIGADEERVRRFREVRDSDEFDGLVALAETLEACPADDDYDDWDLIEEYNAGQYVHRAMQNFGMARVGGDAFQAFRDAFYGDYSETQEACRDHETLNLAWYRVMFPEPTERFPGEPIDVTTDLGGKWAKIGLPGEDGKQDTPIYLTREFCEEYAPYATDEGIPMPPEDFPDDVEATVDSSGEAQEVSRGTLDPSDHTVDELRAKVANIDSLSILSRVLAVEEDGKDRKTAREVIEKRIAEVATGN